MAHCDVGEVHGYDSEVQRVILSLWKMRAMRDSATQYLCKKKNRHKVPLNIGLREILARDADLKSSRAELTWLFQ